ncbi:MAG TPA: LPS export ABC transporter permease LptG [Candidatus Manganitrophaceae bacterium]|nr:LPS export ABC transporter permease LptG [Candidatus Manganitrophaceae bacterium]
MMSIISRYVLKEYLKIFFMTLAALLAVYLAIDFLEKIRKFSQKDAELIWVARYFLYKLPKVVFDIAPLALLLATLLTLGTLSKNNEVVALKSAGVGVLRLSAPLLLFAALVSLLFFYLNGSLIPGTYKKARLIQQVKIEKRDQGGLVQNKIWLRLDSRTLFNIELIHPDKTSMEGVNIYYLGADFSLPEEIEAQTLTYEKGEWTLSNGVHRKFLPDGTVQFERFIRKPIPLDKKPEDFQRVSADPNEMTYEKLTSYIHRLNQDGFDSTRYQVDLRGKQAFPFVNFMMVLIGIPFALGDRRSAGFARGVAMSLAMGLFYWLIYSMTLSLGHVAVFPPWLAGWGANILFLGAGIYFFLNIRQ